MQLIFITVVFIIFMGIQDVKAQLTGGQQHKNSKKDGENNQEKTEQTYHRADWKKVEINFLNSYYSQDGDNAAVTGGIGTEQLTDFTQKITISVPTSPKFRINVDGAYDYYSSASTDNIDNIRSSDSSSDIRAQFGAGFEYDMNDQVTTHLRLGTSVEYDYISLHAGGGFNIASKNRNSVLSLSAQAFYDTWIPYYPKELRGKVSIPTDKRQSYNFSLSFNQVLTRRFQAALMVESTVMNGLLSTPFHRVYFKDKELPDIERLPSQRLKLPIGIRLNYHMTDWLIMRSYYRYYYDNWGVTGHTASIELPIKLNRFFAVYPQYRYHEQTAADHFAPYKEHDSQQEFYTSDFDLAELSAHSVGLGVMYSRSDGIAKVKLPFVKNRHLKLESIDLKGSYYLRSTGLKGFIFSLGGKVSF